MKKDRGLNNIQIVSSCMENGDFCVYVNHQNDTDGEDFGFHVTKDDKTNQWIIRKDGYREIGRYESRDEAKSDCFNMVGNLIKNKFLPNLISECEYRVKCKKERREKLIMDWKNKENALSTS